MHTAFYPCLLFFWASLSLSRLLELTLSFPLKTFHLNLIETHFGPTCYRTNATVSVSNIPPELGRDAFWSHLLQDQRHGVGQHCSTWTWYCGQDTFQFLLVVVLLALKFFIPHRDREKWKCSSDHVLTCHSLLCSSMEWGTLRTGRPDSRASSVSPLGMKLVCFWLVSPVCSLFWSWVGGQDCEFGILLLALEMQCMKKLIFFLSSFWMSP